MAHAYSSLSISSTWETINEDIPILKAECEKILNAAFGRKAIPDNIPECAIERSQEAIGDIITKLIERNFVNSKSEFMRLVNQGGVQLNGKKLESKDIDRVLASDDVMKIGKKRFIRFIDE